MKRAISQNEPAYLRFGSNLDYKDFDVVVVQSDEDIDISNISMALVSCHAPWSGTSATNGKLLLNKLAEVNTKGIAMYLLDIEGVSYGLKQYIYGEKSCHGYFESAWIENGKIQKRCTSRNEIEPFAAFVKARIKSKNMTTNEKLLISFYQAFQKSDYSTMQACYADHATFTDPVFKNLNANEVKAMWQMVITRAKDFHLEFSNVDANEKNGAAEWKAAYIFSATGNKVVNKIKADFVFENGKIVNHIDSFDFYTWAKQAFGIKGLLLGWTTFMQKKVKSKARQGLQKYMAKEN